jgi:uncharacterized protein YciI
VAAPKEGSLKRLGGGRWQTPDGRFTIEPQSGTWSVVDAEHTDELGMPLVRGPYKSLTAAKAAIADAEAGDAPVSPLADRLKEARSRPPAKAGTRTAARAGSQPATTSKARAKAVEPPPPPEIPEGLAVETIFVIEAPYAKDAADRRPAVRHEHLARIGRLFDDGRLIEAGGYADLSTAILLVKARSEAEALAMFRNDVYIKAGVWTGELRAKPFGRVIRDRSR